MLGFLGFIGLLIMTFFLISTGVYKQFVILCVALIAIGIVFEIEFLAVSAGTLLFGSFFALMLIGSNGDAPEPRGTVDWRE